MIFIQSIYKFKYATILPKHLLYGFYIKEYEDFADYIEQAKNFIEGFGLVFIKMTKGFKVAIRHIDTLVEIKITKSGANVTYISDE